MSFYIYYIFHFIIGVVILLTYFYLLKKIVFDTKIPIKLLCLSIFLLLSNTPAGKYSLYIFNISISSYHYQNCEGNFHIKNTQFEHKWSNKQEIQRDMKQWHEQYHRKEEDIVYRTFDFKWWMFWEYYTYYTTDVYELPLLPKECKKMN